MKALFTSICFLAALLWCQACFKAPATSMRERSERPVINWGFPYLVPGADLPANVVAVYLDGFLVECQGVPIGLEDVEGYVEGAVKANNAEAVFVFTTSDVSHGRLVEVLSRLRDLPVKLIRIDDRSIPNGFRYAVRNVPNKSVEVTPTAVTPAADAPGAPSAGVPHH